VGITVGICTLLFSTISIFNFTWIVVFALLAGAIMGCLGTIAGVWAEKFDQMAVFQNFIIMPATFLSGVFYSINSLPPFWQMVSHANPLFYLIDGFRYGFFGVSDVNPWFSLSMALVGLALCAAITLRMLAISYKLRH
jgi:ABC-2 type transport system permease protein